MAKKQITNNDIAHFIEGFETFKSKPYQLKNEQTGEMQNLIGYGFADQNLIDKGTITQEQAHQIVLNKIENIRQNLMNAIPNFAKLDSETQAALIDTAYNGSDINTILKKSPRLLQLLNSGETDPYKIIQEMDHSKSAGGWLGVRSSARRAMVVGDYDWENKNVDKYGRQIIPEKVGEKDYMASPYYNKTYEKYPEDEMGNPIIPYKLNKKQSVYNTTPRKLKTFSDFIASRQSGGWIPNGPIKLMTTPGIQYNPTNYIYNTALDRRIYGTDPFEKLNDWHSPYRIEIKPGTTTTSTVRSSNESIPEENDVETTSSNENVPEVQNVEINQSEDLPEGYTYAPMPDNKVLPMPNVETPKRITTDYSSNKTLSNLAESYKRSLSKYGIDESYLDYLIAQDALESGWGNKIVGTYNYGNITVPENIAGKISWTAGKDRDGNQIITQRFRNFKNLDDYTYYKVGMLNRLYNSFNTPKTFFASLVNGQYKYATDPNYLTKLNSVLNQIRQGNIN